MAKRKKKSKPASRSNGRKKATEHTGLVATMVSRPPSAEEDVDGCDFVCHENEATADLDLAPAVGGIEVRSQAKPKRAAA